MKEYDKQANDFLKSTNTTIEARFLGIQEKYFGNEDQARDIYEIKITRGSREWVFKFGASINDTEERLSKIFGKHDKYAIQEFRIFGLIVGNSLMKKSQITKQEKELKEWAKAGTTFRPSEYSILACLTKYEPCENVDDFASEYGYDKPSEAIKAYEAVKEEWQNIKMLFSDEEIEKLQDIN